MSSSCRAASSAKPSANDCIIPYSMPLWIILAKWPAPLGPQCSQPRSASGASSRAKGSKHLDRLRRAAEHQAVAVREAVHAARDAGVDVAQALLRQGERAAHRVAVVALPPSTSGVARGEQRQQVADGLLDRVARRQQEEDDALAGEPRAQRREVLHAFDVALAAPRALRAGSAWS